MDAKTAPQGVVIASDFAIQSWDAALALPSFRPDDRLRNVSGLAKGAWRQYRDCRLRPFGFLDVFHAERVLSGVSALAGEGPGPLRRPDVVRDRQNSLRQLHSRHARRGRPRASAALFRAHGDAAGGAPDAASLRSVGRQDPDRLGRNGVFLLTKARLSELPHPRALQRQDRALSLCAVGDGRGARPFQGRSLDARVRGDPASRPRTRRSTTSSTAPNFPVTRRRSVAATPRRRCVIAGSRRFRSATARTRYWSTGSASKFSTPTERPNIPWPG